MLLISQISCRGTLCEQDVPRQSLSERRPSRCREGGCSDAAVGACIFRSLSRTVSRGEKTVAVWLHLLLQHLFMLALVLLVELVGALKAFLVA